MLQVTSLKVRQWFVPLLSIMMTNSLCSATQLEDTESLMMTEVEEKITFDKSGDHVSASYHTNKHFLATKFGDSYVEEVSYDATTCEVSNVYGVSQGSWKTWKSSNNTSDGIFYDGMNVYSLSVSLNRKGQTAYFSYTQKFLDAIYLGSLDFSEPLYVEKKTVQVTVPSWLDMEIKEFNFGDKVTKTVEQKSKSTVYTYVIENQKKMPSEKRMPNRREIYPSILFVYRSAKLDGGEKVLFKSAQDQYKWYQSLIAQNVEKKDTVCQEVKKIVAGCKTDKEKMKAIYEWVQENIRYIAFEDGMAGFRPQVAHEVLDNKYGDCKGMANLLCKMLECVGIDARMVWIGTRGIPYDYTTPSLAVDNHAICAAIIGKDTTYLDATCEYISMGQYTSSIAGRATMVENGANCILTHVPDVSPRQNLDTTFVTISLKDGKMCGTYKNILNGEEKVDFLYSMENYDNDLMETLQKNGYKGLPSDESQVKVSGGKSGDLQYTIEYPYIWKRDLSQAGNDYYVSMDMNKMLASMDVDVKKRTTALDFGSKKCVSYTSELTVPAGMKVAYTPSNLLIDKPKYRFEIKYSISGGKVVYKRNITIKQPVIDVKEFAEWNADVRKLKNAYLSQILLSGNKNTSTKSNSKSNNKKKK